jgi:hypothetical protein
MHFSTLLNTLQLDQGKMSRQKLNATVTQDLLGCINVPSKRTSTEPATHTHTHTHRQWYMAGSMLHLTFQGYGSKSSVIIDLTTGMASIHR